MDTQPTRGSRATALMAALALLISVWGIVAVRQAGAGGLTRSIKVYDDKGDCPSTADPCSFLTDNSVSRDELISGSVGTTEVIANAINGTRVAPGSLDGSDIGTLNLNNIQGVFPSVVATKSLEMAATSNAYIGKPPGAPSNPAFFSFDTVTEHTVGAWAPCETDPAAPPPYPCLDVPTSGNYLITIEARWEDNSVGTREVALIATPVEAGGCGPGQFTATFYSVLRDSQPAANLTVLASESKRLQVASVLAPLEAGQCIVAYARSGDGNVTSDLAYTLSMVMQ